MNRRTDLVAVIHALARDEGTRQPTAGEWLADLDKRAIETMDGPQPNVERMPDPAPEGDK